MVIILGIRKSFVSIRWKLVSTYLLLIILTLVLMFSFVKTSLEKNLIEEKKEYLLTQATIIGNQIAPDIDYIGTRYTKAYYRTIINDFSLEIDSRIIVFDTEKKVLLDAYSFFEEDAVMEINEVNRASMGQSVAEYYTFDKVGRVLYVAAPINQNNEVVGIVFISSSLEELFESVNNTMKSLFYLSVTSIILTGIVSFLFADILSRPIEKLSEIVHTVSFGGIMKQVEVTGNDEINVLSNSFNSILTRLNQVDQQRRQFVANVSHELRTPLTSIKILSNSLLQDENISPEIYREFLTDIDSEVDRLNKIIDSLLYLVNMEKKELVLEYSLTYVNFLIERVVRKLKPLADNKDITINFQDDKRIQINLDQHKMQQCLINVINNAIKYTPANGDITINLYTDKNDCVISVKDTGVGIPEDDLPYIFDRFYRVNKARNRSPNTQGGSGLGLSISQQVVNLHHGQILVESENRKGTTFYIRIPLKTPGL